MVLSQTLSDPGTETHLGGSDLGHSLNALPVFRARPYPDYQAIKGTAFECFI